ncbi:MAG: NfeD family protein [Cyanobacteria bacterium P01_F01_bin.56]
MNSFESLSSVFFLPTDRGLVVKAISRDINGRVKYQASYWAAQLSDDATKTVIEPGATVQIIGRIGNTLLVEPI